MPPDGEPIRRRPPTERERIAESIADHLDKPLTVAGLLFALLVLADTTVSLSGGARTAFDVFTWLLWGLFVVEYVVRMIVAPSVPRFLRRNWWQLIFLVVPFLRFLRPLARLRIPRVGRILSWALRTSRSAARRLTGRLGWLAALTTIVILAASQLLYELGEYASYAEALYDAAMAAITGQRTDQAAGVVRILEVVLALFSVVVFATLAGSLGAYFLERGGEDDRSQAQPSGGEPVAEQPHHGPGAVGGV